LLIRRQQVEIYLSVLMSHRNPDGGTIPPYVNDLIPTSENLDVRLFHFLIHCSVIFEPEATSK